MKKQPGFTLIELMIVVALLGIILLIGVPSFKQSMARSQISTQSHALLTALMLARTEAVKRSEAINLVAIAPVANNEWGGGWQIVRASNQEVLSIYVANSHVNLGSSNGVSQFQFNSRGMLASAQTDSIAICHQSVSVSGQAIEIGATGRAHISPGNC